MKDKFRSYYSPTSSEFDDLWGTGIIVFDANALLNLFRYSASTRDEWLELLKKEKERLWIPYQVGLEFHRHRREIASHQEKAFADVGDAIRKAEVSVKESINGLRRHPTLEAAELTAAVQKHMKRVRKRFKAARAEHFEAVHSKEAHEKTLTAITDLFESSVGDPTTAEDLKAIYKEGADRYDRKQPPGYMDAKKDGDDKYGDLVLWRQILAYGEQTKKPLIFITDDAKEDWWSQSSGKTFGPRPELVEEYFEASGQRAHFYQPREFLRQAQDRGEAITEAAVAEAQSVSGERTVRYTNRKFSERLAEYNLMNRLRHSALDDRGISEFERLTAETRGHWGEDWRTFSSNAAREDALLRAAINHALTTRSELTEEQALAARESLRRIDEQFTDHRRTHGERSAVESDPDEPDASSPKDE